MDAAVLQAFALMLVESAILLSLVPMATRPVALVVRRRIRRLLYRLLLLAARVRMLRSLILLELSLMELVASLTLLPTLTLPVASLSLPLIAEVSFSPSYLTLLLEILHPCRLSLPFHTLSSLSILDKLRHTVMYFVSFTPVFSISFYILSLLIPTFRVM